MVDRLKGFFDFILTSALLDQLSEYNLGETITHGRRAGSTTKETDHTQVAIPHDPICQLYSSHGGKRRPRRAGSLTGGRPIRS